ncbi:hypothetical protein HZR81_20845 [Pseudomonas sp. LM13]
MLIGHPEHDLLFIATQVARAAGLKNPSELTSRLATTQFSGKALAFKLNDLGVSTEITETLKPHVQGKSWLHTEAATYKMLTRGHAPQSEPFRKWVFKEVLPSIRKTGSYNVNESGRWWPLIRS